MPEEKKTVVSTVIIAPHPDDEIIGCFEQIKNPLSHLVIIYSGDTDADRRETVLNLKKEIDQVKLQLFQNSVPPTFLNKSNRFFFPDPIYETHPKHREWGMVGESMARQGFNVIFYNTIMNAPYIHEVNLSDDKKYLLNKVYPDQKSLWEYDHKYFLFEGYNKWIF
jgi:hypothetical protein